MRENPDAFNRVIRLCDIRNIFCAPIHNPIMLTLDVKDRNFAWYVESHIGRADLEVFVGEDPKDVTKQLRKNLRLFTVIVHLIRLTALLTPYSKEEISKVISNM